MNGKIAIDPGLTNIKNYLIKQGYSVDNINFDDKKSLNSYDAFIVSGLSSNCLGMEDTQARASVISAAGLTPEEVLQQLRQ